jgi:SAM-dependent methyltransferase
MSHYVVEHLCRSCKSAHLKPILAFGETPLADRLLTQDQLNQPELTAPLTLAFCQDCFLVQILETVQPEILFGQDYPYFSSVSQALAEHTRKNALEIIEARGLNSSSLVIEPASNDGYMLRNFQEQGISVLGIDPAAGPAEAAAAKGIPTLHTFFTRELAEQLRSQGKFADVIIANNVLAHVEDLNGFVAGIACLLKDSGVAVLEMPYVVDLIEKVEFDTIYHQHLCYFSVSTLEKLFSRHGLFLNDIRRVLIHGGSLRLFVEKIDRQSDDMRNLKAFEHSAGVDTLAYFQHFAGQVQTIKKDLTDLLNSLISNNCRIAGYGAAAKATTLMAYCEIGKKHLEYIIDLNPFKHGRFMGGNQLPIYPVSHLQQNQPDYLLILAWNFADEIMRQQEPFQRCGGQFIIPIPFPKVVSA